MTAPLTCLLLTLSLLVGNDETTVAERIVDQGLSQSQVMEHLDALVNGIGPRLTGSSSLTEACEWAVERFASYGLDARMEKWGEFAVGFERGPWTGHALTQQGLESLDLGLTFITRAWSPGTDGAARGPAVLVEVDLDALSGLRDIEDRDERAAATAAIGEQMIEPIVAKLPGAWVLAPRQVRSVPLLRGAIEDAVQAAGAHGIVYPSRDTELLVMGGRAPDSLDEAADVIWIELLASQWVALRTMLTGTEASEAVEAVEATEDSEAIEATEAVAAVAPQDVVLEFDIDNTLVEGPVDQFNVIADLVGCEFPDEYVIVGGHLDSWDGATGTNDNGTGVSSTIEAARLLTAAGVQPRRTIRFMLWSGEEQGLLGSRAYVEAHPELLDKISAVLVHDGGTNAVSGIAVTPAMREQMETAFADVIAYTESTEGATPFTIEELPGLQAAGGSDHVPFISAGVPGFFWRQEGETDYRHVHHTQHDHYESAREDYQKHTSVVVALGALGIADLPDMISRTRMIVPRRMLGVYMEEDGRTLGRVIEGGKASAAGMLSGDKLVSIGGTPIDGTARLRGILGGGEPRKLVVFEREGETQFVVLTWDVGDIEREPEIVDLTTADGVAIQGDYFMGAVDGPAAGSALILLHMYKADRSTWAPVRPALYERGIATLALDLRGHGKSVDADGTLAARVEGRDPTLVRAMPADVVAATDWLVAQGYPPERIGLMGASIGCSVALRTAAGDERLAGAALLTPGKTYLEMDSMKDAAAWDLRPLLIVSSEEEVMVGARPLYDAIRARDPWTPVQLVILDEEDVHGTHMFGKVPGIEAHLADWWVPALR